MRRCCWILIETHANLALVQQRNATSGLYLARYPLALSRKRALAGGVFWVLRCLDYRPESSPAGWVQHLHSRVLGFEREHPIFGTTASGQCVHTTSNDSRVCPSGPLALSLDPKISKIQRGDATRPRPTQLSGPVRTSDNTSAGTAG